MPFPGEPAGSGPSPEGLTPLRDAGSPPTRRTSPTGRAGERERERERDKERERKEGEQRERARKGEIESKKKTEKEIK